MIDRDNDNIKSVESDSIAYCQSTFIYSPIIGRKLTRMDADKFKEGGCAIPSSF
jgi:hypothetical protein